MKKSVNPAVAAIIIIIVIVVAAAVMFKMTAVKQGDPGSEGTGPGKAGMSGMMPPGGMEGSGMPGMEGSEASGDEEATDEATTDEGEEATDEATDEAATDEATDDASDAGDEASADEATDDAGDEEGSVGPSVHRRRGGLGRPGGRVVAFRRRHEHAGVPAFRRNDPDVTVGLVLLLENLRHREQDCLPVGGDLRVGDPVNRKHVREFEGALVLGDNRCKWPAVVGKRNDRGRVCWLAIVGMNEVSVGVSRHISQ